jgi:hypothetical protein
MKMTREEFLSIAGKHYDSIVELKSHNDFYDYEVGFLDIHRKMGKEILEKSIGVVPSNKRKKKLY